MKALVLGILCAALLSPAAHAWAIILGSPSLQYPATADRPGIAATEAAMQKLGFEGGIIHVSAPAPSRQLRFEAPGQSANSLPPLLEKLGFKVKVVVGDRTGKSPGIIITQMEDGSNLVTILINARHPEFDRKKLATGKWEPAGQEVD